MNYLAHLYLAEDSPESMTGSIPEDFVKGAIGEIQNHYRRLEENFLSFFPDLMHFVENLKKGSDLPA
jgi:acyl carrier protein phosphodiesterase